MIVRQKCISENAKSHFGTRSKTVTVSEQDIASIRKIHLRLLDRYGTPDLGNVEDVFGELVYAMLSTRSIPSNYQRAFSTLIAAFPQWSDLAKAQPCDVNEILRPCGLYNRKTKAILAIARQVFLVEGLHDLEHLRNLSTEEAEAYLTSLPEVGLKIAKCVCLYALHRPVFPLDVHSLRVLKRLGIVEKNAIARDSARKVESIIPSEIRLDFHVNLVVHGREVCRARPMCSNCIFRDICPYPSLRGSSS